MHILVLLCTKFISFLSSLLKRGEGSALPGLIALKLYPKILNHFTPQFRQGIILISGTNGKTTTSSLIAHILLSQSYQVIHNSKGSNLMRGITSSIIQHSNVWGHLQADYGVFEVDEAVLPEAIAKLHPKIIVLNNLFRDQLDRYGELDTVAYKWKQTLQKLDKSTTLVLNANDPLIASLGKAIPCAVYYYGLECETENKHTHQYGDSVFCQNCLTALSYQKQYYSHIGVWNCPHCQNKTPEQIITITESKPHNEFMSLKIRNKNKIISVTTKLHGIYNAYNVAAAYLTTQIVIQLNHEEIETAIASFTPSFGRQEVVTVGNKKVYLILSKNPTGFSQSITTIAEKDPKTILFILNDKIADGEDVSWIADIDFSPFQLNETTNIISGTRAYDLALRLKYEDKNIKYTLEPDIEKALTIALDKTKSAETLYIMPTYTAMLEVRKLLTGKTLT